MTDVTGARASVSVAPGGLARVGDPYCESCAVPHHGCNPLWLPGSRSSSDPLEAASRPRHLSKDHSHSWGGAWFPLTSMASLLLWPLSLLCSEPKPSSLLIPHVICGWPVVGKTLHRPISVGPQLLASDITVSVLKD
ncbi:hypothetical protein VULLAG_LOCUS16548 [Vulpes lagopus]